ncbi:MAG: response regulator [Acidobacteriia bacterium]|nr:response regulator [Terriglobia bacterium]
MTTLDEVMAPGPENATNKATLDHCPAERVLIVDDEPAACKLLATLLSAAGFACGTASSGEAALGLLQREKPDAVISDLNMPGMTGMELLAAVRRQYSYLALLVTTGVDDVRMGIQAMKLGADDYLVKPLQEEVVIASLKRALQKKRLEQEVEGYRHHLEEIVTERTQQIERSYEDTLGALGAAIDLRDASTEGHSRRVCRYSLEIAKTLSLSDLELRNIAMGAYLHDIGKLAIPDGILLKPGPLTPEERKIMQKHVMTGYDLVKQIPFLVAAAELILNHHERCDGSGYPRGLKVEHIPVSARIFAIADTFDAITSDRPYRRALSFEAGLSVIRHASGRLFDPQVVSAFVGIPPETWLTIARHQRQIAALPSWVRGGGSMGPSTSRESPSHS